MTINDKKNKPINSVSTLFTNFQVANRPNKFKKDFWQKTYIHMPGK